MSLNSNEIFSRLLTLFDTQKMNELSTLLGYKESWGAATRKRGGIPFDACVIAAEKFDVTMDYLLFGSGTNDSVEKKIAKMKQEITNGFFEVIQAEMVKVEKDVSISSITEIIALRLNYLFEYNTDEARLMSEKFIDSLKQDK